MDIIDRIKIRYHQCELGKVESIDSLQPCDLRRVAFDTGAAVLCAVIGELILQQVMIYLLVWLLGFPFMQNTVIYTIVSYTFSSIISYLPKILAFGVLYKKYRVLNERFPKYENKIYYPAIILLAIFSFGMWGSQITNLINYALQLLFGMGEIPDVMDMAAPIGVGDGVVQLIMSALLAPLAEEFIYRHLLLKPLRTMGDTPAILISALIFGLAHANFDQFAYSFLSGIIFGITAVRYGSILAPVILHLLNNLLVSIITYRELLLSGNAIWDGFVNTAVVIGTAIVNCSYYAAPLIAAALIISGMARLVPVTGATRKETGKKLCTVLCPMLMFAFFVMLMMFH